MSETDRGANEVALERNEQTRQAHRATTPAIKQLPGHLEAQVGSQQTETRQIAPHELRDLAAQEDMAFWAMWMFLAAVATLMVTSFGTLLIWRQVRLTRAAVEGTNEATTAMKAANEIARDTAQRQLRAYVFPMRLEWEWALSLETGKKAMAIKPIFRNLGPSQTRARFVIGSKFELNAEEQFSSVQPPDGGQVSLLGPQHEVWAPFVYILEEDVEAVRKGTKQFFVFGAVFYEDIFSVSRVTRFCWEISFWQTNLDDGISRVNWTYAGPHNCADDECAP